MSLASPGRRCRRTRLRRDAAGIESTADALMYLAIMMLASAAVFALFPVSGSADPAVEQERLMDGARWAAVALAGTEVGDNGSVAFLLGCGGWFDEAEVFRIMGALVPEGYDWNVTWMADGMACCAGDAPHGSVGSHVLELSDGTLMVRVFRK